MPCHFSPKRAKQQAINAKKGGETMTELMQEMPEVEAEVQIPSRVQKDVCAKIRMMQKLFRYRPKYWFCVHSTHPSGVPSSPRGGYDNARPCLLLRMVYYILSHRKREVGDYYTQPANHRFQKCRRVRPRYCRQKIRPLSFSQTINKSTTDRFPLALLP